MSGKGLLILCLSCTLLNCSFGDDSVNAYFDLIFANLREMIIQKQIEPIYLPTDGDNFTAMLFNRTLDGSIWVGDGEVSGFATIHRTGNMTIELAPEGHETIIGGHVGLTGIKAKYSTKFHLGPFSSNFGVHVQISFVSLDIKTDVFRSASALSLEECAIDDLSTLQVHLKGIGLFDTRGYNLIINALTEIIQPVLISKIEGVVCNLLEEVINRGYAPTAPPALTTDPPAIFWPM